MKKNYRILVSFFAFVLLAPNAFAGTWVSSGSDTYYTGGNVGIGTTTPDELLDLETDSLVPFMEIGSSGTNASGSYSIAMGFNSTATGLASVAIGANADASGAYSTAMGVNTTASGNQSIVMGDDSSATKAYAFAAGYDNTASGQASLALGTGSTASGDTSISIGIGSTASGTNSTAMGNETTARSYGSMAVGRYNIITGTTGYWLDTDPLFVIGNGTSIIPSNALTVLKNGKVGIGTNSPGSKLDITGGTDTGLSGNAGYMIIGSKTGNHISIDDNEIMAKGGATSTNTLHLNYDGGNVIVGGSSGHVYLNMAHNSYSSSVCRSGERVGYCSSLRKLKKNIKKLDLGLDTVMELEPVSYKWKNKEVTNGMRDLGFIAEEVEAVNPLMAEYSDGELQGVKYRQMTAVLTKAIQELKTEKDAEIAELKAIVCIDHPKAELCRK